jgi:predicted ATP-dependent endonuclease of OLD family
VPVKLRKINLMSGDSIDVADGVTVIVGPNNVGKSKLLRELRDTLAGGARARSVVVAGLETERRVSSEQFIKWIRQAHGLREPGR